LGVRHFNVEEVRGTHKPVLADLSKTQLRNHLQTTLVVVLASPATVVVGDLAEHALAVAVGSLRCVFNLDRRRLKVLPGEA
jgi:hypothetical protein